MTIINLTPHPLVIQRSTRMPVTCEKIYTNDLSTGLYISPDARTVCGGALVVSETAVEGALECNRCHTYTIPIPVTETIPSSGIARCETTDEVIGNFNGIPIIKTKFGRLVGLPDEVLICQYSGDRMDPVPSRGYYDGGNTEDPWEKYRSAEGMACGHPHECQCAGRHETVYVVSSIAAQAVPERKDIFVPARPVRDEAGRIIACAALGRL